MNDTVLWTLNICGYLVERRLSLSGLVGFEAAVDAACVVAVVAHFLEPRRFETELLSSGIST